MIVSGSDIVRVKFNLRVSIILETRFIDIYSAASEKLLIRYPMYLTTVY